jgi:hypothetical protein
VKCYKKYLFIFFFGLSFNGFIFSDETDYYKIISDYLYESFDSSYINDIDIWVVSSENNVQRITIYIYISIPAYMG